MAILLIDDCVDTQRLIIKYLENAGITEQIITARSGDEGIAKLSEDIDLVLLDVVMPDKDGIMTCQEIKSNPMYADIPVMFITQNTSLDILEKAFLAGASDFIKKPFDKLELQVRVRSLLRLSHEMKERKQRENELKRLSMIDGLTGISNRRFFDETIEREWRLAVRNGHPLSLILFDIDHFKNYNDVYGHQCGDEALKAIAKASAEELKRPTDVIARYGGEEFAVILPNTNSQGAYYIAECIRKQVESIGIFHSKYQICGATTVSLGVAEIDRSFSNPASIAQLIEKADQALYQAKHMGRNCTFVAKK